MTDDRFCVKRVTKAHLHLAIVYERTKMDNVEQLRAKLTETKRKLKIVKKKMKKLEELLRPKEITERDYKLLRIYPAQQKCEKKNYSVSKPNSNSSCYSLPSVRFFFFQASLRAS